MATKYLVGGWTLGITRKPYGSILGIDGEDLHPLFDMSLALAPGLDSGWIYSVGMLF